MDPEFYSNMNILYDFGQRTVQALFTAYIKMIPKDYLPEINRVIKENSELVEPCGVLRLEHLFNCRTEENTRLLLENGIEPFNRQTKTFIRTRYYDITKKTSVLAKYGLFRFLRRYHKGTLANITHQNPGACYNYDYPLYIYMIKYYTEKSDQEALEILAKVGKKPSEKPIDTPTEVAVEAQVEASIEAQVKAPIDRVALNKLCDEMIQQANQIKALLN
jgi:hypothetical protein